MPARAMPLRAEGRPPSAHDELVATLADLQVTSEKLTVIDPYSLSDKDFERWSKAVNKIDLAIARARNSLLSGIADDSRQLCHRFRRARRAGSQTSKK